MIFTPLAALNGATLSTMRRRLRYLRYNDEVPGIKKMKDGLEGRKLDERLETLLQLCCKCPMPNKTPKAVVESKFHGPSNQGIHSRNRPAENLG